MKKVLIIFILFFSYLYCSAQTFRDKWDSKTTTYTNYTLGFFWHLAEDLSWSSQPSRQKNAIFAAVETDTRIVTYVTAVKADSKAKDIWIEAESFKRGILANLADGSKLEKVEKVHFAGKKALKTTMSYSLSNDARFNTSMKFLIIQYTVLLQGYAVSFSVMASDEVENEFKKYGLGINETMFSGIVLTSPNQLK